MPIRSVLEIDVQDDAFKRFNESFTRYKEAVDKTPQAWRTITAGAHAAGDEFKTLAALLLAQNEHLAKTLRDMNAFGRATGDATRHMTALERTTRSVAGFVKDATHEILKWEKITAVVSGLAGFGGLFGLVALGRRAVGDYRTATGYGVSPGEYRALRAVFPQIADPEAMLAAAAAGHFNVIGPQGAAAFFTGANVRANPFEMVIQGLRSARTYARSVQDEGFLAAGPVPEQFARRGIDANTLVRLRRTSDEEFEAQVKELRMFAKRAEQDEKTSKAWNRLMLDLGEAGTLIENAFIKGLTPMVPQIGRLSQEFTRFIEVLFREGGPFAEFVKAGTAGFKWLADNIDTPEFKESVKDFLKGLTDVARALVNFARWAARMAGVDVGDAPGTKTFKWGDQYAIVGGSEALRQWADAYQQGLRDQQARGELTPEQARADWRRVFGALPSAPETPPAGAAGAAGAAAMGRSTRGPPTEADISHGLKLYAWATQRLGLDPAHAQAFLANAWAESGFDPLARGRAGELGLFQWKGERLTQMQSALGQWASNPFAQLEYAAKEQYRLHPEWFRTAPAEVLTPEFEHGFERPKRETGRLDDLQAVIKMLGQAARQQEQTSRRQDQHSSSGYGPHVAVNLRIDNRTGAQPYITGSQLGALA